jgi:Protein of unknown function (DUF3300)
MSQRKLRAILLATACIFSFGRVSYAQNVPTGEQLNQLVAPIALYPDTLLAQICAASTDPQQIVDANNWLKQNANLHGQALTDAAQNQGFDPAFISLVTFPAVLDNMAIHIDDYAALGAAFKADQASVMAAIQALRQQAYASGALDSNQYQQVSVEQQNGAQVVVVQPANPQVIYVPQYQPEVVFVSGPSQSDVIAASLVSFSVGIAIGALIHSSQPWAWGGWGWGWGGGGMYYHRNVWVVHNVYRSPHPYYRPRPPVYGRPIYGRPPPNWNQRPGYRPPPPGYRPPIHGPGYRPPPAGNRPPGGGGYKPPPGNGGKPPGNGNGGRPPGDGNGNGGRPPTGGGGYKPPPGNGNGNGNGGRPPGDNSGGNRPPGNGGGNRPPGNGGTTRPAPAPAPAPQPRPSPSRPAPTPQPRPQTRPANPYAGFPQGGKPQQSRPTPQQTGARPGGYSGNFSGKSERAASDRGKASSNGGNRPGGQRK